MKEKRGIINNFKVYFLIVNLVFAVVAFSWGVGELDNFFEEIGLAMGVELVSGQEITWTNPEDGKTWIRGNDEKWRSHDDPNRPPFNDASMKAMGWSGLFSEIMRLSEDWLVGDEYEGLPPVTTIPTGFERAEAEILAGESFEEFYEDLNSVVDEGEDVEKIIEGLLDSPKEWSEKDYENWNLELEEWSDANLKIEDWEDFPKKWTDEDYKNFNDYQESMQDVIRGQEEAQQALSEGGLSEKAKAKLEADFKKAQEERIKAEEAAKQNLAEAKLKSLKEGMTGTINGEKFTLQKVDGKWVGVKSNKEIVQLNEEQLKTFKADPKIPPTSAKIIENAMSIGTMFGLGILIGGFIGGNADISLGTALAVVTFIGQAQAGDWTGTFLEGPADFIGDIGSRLDILGTGSGGVIIGAIIFAVMYKKTSTETVEFNCLPYQPPIGGGDCEKCNIFGECSEYRCKSLGQACELLNAGTQDEKCDWVNPRDVNSPMIKVESVLKGYKYEKDGAVRPPATGVVISNKTDGSCVEAFTLLEFTLLTDEPAQCKIDYNLTHSFDEMSYYIGGSNLFSYNHTEEMSLPGPDAINAIAPELKNDGTYTLYARCQDANGNFNQDAFSVRFCVKPGPDTTAPRIEAVNVPSNSPINYEQTSLDLEVYVNEPSKCKWSRTDTSFDNMETSMDCNNKLWEMNNNNVYTCRTTLTGIQDRKENSYYFKCQDVSDNLNTNTQSYLYNIVGTQPLNILSIEPNETIRDSTDTIPVLLVVRTDNGYKNGEAICYYYNDANNNAPVNNEDYIEFLETGENVHEQRQDLDSGTYTYYYKCVDLGGNTAYDSTTFNVEVDRQGPVVVRAYKSSGELKIITNEKAECAYSNKDCNFDIDEGIQMTTLDNEAHNSEWKTTKNYYIRCKDEYDNQPPLNVDAVGCSIVVRPYEILANEGVIVL